MTQGKTGRRLLTSQTEKKSRMSFLSFVCNSIFSLQEKKQKQRRTRTGIMKSSGFVDLLRSKKRKKKTSRTRVESSKGDEDRVCLKRRRRRNKNDKQNN